MEVFSGELKVDKREIMLTKAEIEARETWNAKRDELSSEIRSRAAPSCTTAGDLLKSSILPMKLSTGNASARSKWNEKRRKRLYPPTLEEWTGVQEDMEIPFGNAEVILKKPPADPLWDSAEKSTRASGEIDEQTFLRQYLWEKLLYAGLSCMYLDVPKAGLVHGRPDEVTFVDEKNSILSAVIEFKSSQNLLVPNDFAALKEKYEAAFLLQNTTQSIQRPKDWSQIGHPFAQLFGYMLDNQTRFGALCSGSKTYFAFLDPSGAMKVSRAMFTGNRHFIKAWASFIRLAREDSRTSFDRPQKWLDGTPIRKLPIANTEDNHGDDDDEDDDEDDDQDDDQDDGHGADGGHDNDHGDNDPDPDGSGESRRPSFGKRLLRSCAQFRKNQRSKKTNEASTLMNVKKTGPPLKEQAPSLRRVATPDYTLRSCYEPFAFEKDFVPFVDFSQLQIGKLLGSGRNGDVFQATTTTAAGGAGGRGNDYKGKEGQIVAAVKQFDLTKNFDAYEEEVRAYRYLKKVWEKHVPTPLFISASPSGNVRYLGMTLGVSPEDDTFRGEFLRKVETLEEVYKFRHLDVWGGGPNYILVPADKTTSNGGMKVLVTDLEAWEKVKE
jgi:hypothetical protein